MLPSASLIDQLRQEILRARSRIYQIGAPTPLDTIESHEIGCQLDLKREIVPPSTKMARRLE